MPFMTLSTYNQRGEDGDDFQTAFVDGFKFKLDVNYVASAFMRLTQNGEQYRGIYYQPSYSEGSSMDYLCTKDFKVLRAGEDGAIERVYYCPKGEVMVASESVKIFGLFAQKDLTQPFLLGELDCFCVHFLFASYGSHGQEAFHRLFVFLDEYGMQQLLLVVSSQGGREMISLLKLMNGRIISQISIENIQIGVSEEKEH